jgi:hypothetical protein
MKPLVDIDAEPPLMSIIGSRRQKQTSTRASSMYPISASASGCGHSLARSRPAQARSTPSTLSFQRFIAG